MRNKALEYRKSGKYDKDILTVNVTCDICGRIMKRGETAYSHYESYAPGQRVFWCNICDGRYLFSWN